MTRIIYTAILLLTLNCTATAQNLPLVLTGFPLMTSFLLIQMESRGLVMDALG